MIHIFINVSKCKRLLISDIKNWNEFIIVLFAKLNIGHIHEYSLSINKIFIIGENIPFLTIDIDAEKGESRFDILSNIDLDDTLIKETIDKFFEPLSIKVTKIIRG
jgi:hypothetical protein